MAIRFYDSALLEKLRSWSGDTQLQIFGPDDTRKLFEVYTDQKNDTPVKLPLIALRRVGGYEIINTNKRPITFDGFTLSANTDKSKQLNAIPVNITYQLDIYTRYLSEADELARNIIFNIINYPHLKIQIPYENSYIEHSGTMRIISNVDDNSDVPERLIPGQFTRLTFGLTVDDAYLFDIRIRDNYLIDADVKFASEKN